MDVTEVLEFSTGDIGALDRPVMLVGLEGWFDVAGAASHAVESFVDHEQAVVVGEIDPDPFYDFTQQRPLVAINDGVREIQWPSNEVVLQRNAGHRDIVSLAGVEPHLYWSTYVESIVTVAEALGCEAVVTVGSAAEAIPHTRRPPVTGSSANPDLASRLGLVAPSYEGITGIAGVLHAALDVRGIPSVSLRVGIPHYLMNAEHPQATDALSRHLSHVLGVPSTVDFSDQIDAWRDVHDEIIEGDEQLRMYVRMLEAEFDRRAEAAIPSADDLAAQFEEFLDDLRPDDP
ncbi:PAC2 family protein [Ilumatobacter nonamiensis]|uniref:PAC2 family protein n=1 Tax=Ilumatobacter nonamiensis TaxID=467093 RepID=UPI00034ADF6A|nr:PAC2 family protein [Ilumatobacter nonamiensis]